MIKATARINKSLQFALSRKLKDAKYVLAFKLHIFSDCHGGEQYLKDPLAMAAILLNFGLVSHSCQSI